MFINGLNPEGKSGLKINSGKNHIPSRCYLFLVLCLDLILRLLFLPRGFSGGRFRRVLHQLLACYLSVSDPLSQVEPSSVLGEVLLIVTTVFGSLCNIQDLFWRVCNLPSSIF